MGVITYSASDDSVVTSGKEPFPFCIIDGFLPQDVFELACCGLPPVNDPAWVKYDNPLEVKYALNDRSKFPHVVDSTLELLYGELMRRTIARVLGLAEKEIFPDPLLLGAGIHAIGRGGKLDLHLDHNRNPKLPNMERKVNAIYWFHQSWDEDWGGDLELWSSQDGKPHEKAISIRPVPNRLALFKAGDYSFHGHPTQLNCPDGVFRTSLALYYYSNNLEDKQERLKVHFFKHPGDPENAELDSLRARRADPKQAANVWRLSDTSTPYGS